jgi:hypothetical protein
VSRMFPRPVLSFVVAMGTLAASAQAIDSVHVFKSIPSVGYSTSLAETTAWKLQRSGAPFVSVGASDLQGLNEQLEKRRPVKHMHAQLPGLTHIGFIYLDKAAHVFCLAEEQGLIIDLTARRQFLLEDWTDRMKLRAALVALGL